MYLPAARRVCTICCLLASLLAVAAPAPGKTFLGIEEERIERVIDWCYNLDARADPEIAALAREYPDSPVPSLLRSGLLYWMQNYAEWDEARTAQFEESVEDSLEQAKRFAKQRKDDPDAEFVVAMNELLQVIHFADQHRWWAAFWKSRSALKTMRQLLEENPDYHDAKMPMGMANCYLSQTPGYLKPLAFLMRFKGDMELGLRYLEEAKRHGLFTRVDATYHLGAIREELQKDRSQARAEFANLVQAYPDNLLFQVMLARLDRSLGDAAAARDRAQAALDHRRIADFPGVRAGALRTLVWSALGTGDFELVLRSTDEFAAMAQEYHALQEELSWMRHARAEALQAKGDTEAAVEIWTALAEEKGGPAEKAQERLAQARAARD